jgi:two-component sensor histidine kinase
LDIDTAITLGLIVNELVSNSLKYAFEKEQTGRLLITLEKNEDKKYTLIVEDNGKGIPENFDRQENTPFGLNLVTSLSRKLNGEIHLENNNGTKVILYFVLPS